MVDKKTNGKKGAVKASDKNRFITVGASRVSLSGSVKDPDVFRRRLFVVDDNGELVRLYDYSRGSNSPLKDHVDIFGGAYFSALEIKKLSELADKLDVSIDVFIDMFNEISAVASAACNAGGYVNAIKEHMNALKGAGE